jgi:FtsZ-binding cell division protein ZapB
MLREGVDLASLIIRCPECKAVNDVVEEGEACCQVCGFEAMIGSAQYHGQTVADLQLGAQALLASLTKERAILTQELHDVKRQGEASSKEAAEYASMLESQLETSNVGWPPQMLSYSSVLCCSALESLTDLTPVHLLQTSVVEAAEAMQLLQHELEDMTQQRDVLSKKYHAVESELDSLKGHVETLTVERNRKVEEAAGES